MNDYTLDLTIKDLSNLTRNELYKEVRGNQEFAINTILKFDWIFGAFLLTLSQDFKFGKQRMRKVLDGVRRRFSCYSALDNCDLNQILENYNYKYFFKNGKVLLRDLEADSSQYFDDLSTDLRILACKVERGKELTEAEKKVLELVREVT